MNDRQKRREELAEVMAERGCKERQGRRVLERLRDGRPAPGKGFGPPLIGEEEATDAVLSEYIAGEINAEEAAGRIGEKGVSLSTFHRRRREYVAETGAGSMETVST